jgi:hypothetical protein
MQREAQELHAEVLETYRRLAPKLPPRHPLFLVFKKAMEETGWLCEDEPEEPGEQGLEVALLWLRTAKAAYDGLPTAVRRQWLSGWPLTLPAPDRENLLTRLRAAPIERVLRVENVPTNDGDDQLATLEFSFRPRGCADVVVEVLEGTTKEEAVAALLRIVECFGGHWENCLKHACSPD